MKIVALELASLCVEMPALVWRSDVGSEVRKSIGAWNDSIDKLHILLLSLFLFFLFLFLFCRLFCRLQKNNRQKVLRFQIFFVILHHVRYWTRLLHQRNHHLDDRRAKNINTIYERMRIVRRRFYDGIGLVVSLADA